MLEILIFFSIYLPFPSHSYSIYQDSYSSWASKYHENFKNSTKPPPIDAYQHNLDLINEHNSKDDDFEAGLNKFSYLSTEQFVDNFCGTVLPKKLLSTKPTLLTARKLNDFDEEDLPESISWKKFASPSRNQGDECGSCWAFAVMALLGKIISILKSSHNSEIIKTLTNIFFVLETQNRIKNFMWNKSLAPQYLVDCYKETDKCSGEWPANALSESLALICYFNILELIINNDFIFFRISQI